MLFDFVSGLPNSDGKSAFIVGIDAYGGFVQAEAVRYQTADAAKAFFIHAFLLIFGAPRVVHTDNGSHFLGNFRDFLLGMGIQQCLSSPYFPRAHGKVERVHRLLLDQLRKSYGGFSWPAYLPVAVWHVNARTPKNGRAPLEVLMGIRPRGEMERRIINLIDPAGVPEDEEREAYMEVVRQGVVNDNGAHQVHQGHSQALQEQVSDAPHKPVKSAPQGSNDQAPQEHRAPQEPQRFDSGKRDRLKQGDLVWVYDHGVRKGVGRKLEGKWRGPATIVWVGNHGGLGVKYVNEGMVRRVNVSNIKPFVMY